MYTPFQRGSHHLWFSRYQRTVLSRPDFEGFRRAPTQFSFEFGCVNRIAAIVSRPIDDKRDKTVVGSPIWMIGIHDVADAVDHRKIGLFVSTADIIFFTRATVRQDQIKRARMIFDKQPIAYVLTVAIDGQRPARTGR